MSGILGMWNLDGRPVERALLARLNAQIAHRGPDGEGYWSEGPVGLAHQMFRITPESLEEAQPLSQAGAVIVFDGRLDNREEVLEWVDGTDPRAPDCELVLGTYCKYREAAPERLNGDFAFAIWDPGRQQLLLARDGMGTRPLYYCRAGDTFLFASEIKPILAHPDVRTRPNEETLADWVLRFPGEDNRGTTFFEGIYSVPPAHQAVVSQTGIAVRRYWDFDKTRQIRMSSFEEYTEAFRHYFDQAVRRRLRSAGPVTISVSGGVDSSSLYCRAETLRRASPGSIPQLNAVSHTYPKGSKADEELFLVEIERKYGVEIRRISVPLSGPIAGVEEQIGRVESAFLHPPWSIERAYTQAIKNTGARLVLSGVFGDEFLARNDYAVDYLTQGQWRDLWNYVRRTKGFGRQIGSFVVPRRLIRTIRLLRPAWVSRDWDNGLYTDAFRRRIVDRERAWEAFPGPFASAHAASVYRQARSRYSTFVREASNKLITHHGLEWAGPFLDRDLLGFVMAIPGDVVSVRELKKKLLRSAMQDVLPPAIANRRGKAKIGELLNEVVRRDFEASLLQRLDSYGRMLSTQYIALQQVKRQSVLELASMHGSGVGVAKRYCDLLGLAVWLDVFF